MVKDLWEVVDGTEAKSSDEKEALDEEIPRASHLTLARPRRTTLQYIYGRNPVLTFCKQFSIHSLQGLSPAITQPKTPLMLSRASHNHRPKLGYRPPSG